MIAMLAHGRMDADARYLIVATVLIVAWLLLDMAKGTEEK